MNRLLCMAFGHRYDLTYVDPMFGFPDVFVVCCQRDGHILVSGEVSERITIESKR